MVVATPIASPLGPMSLVIFPANPARWGLDPRAVELVQRRTRDAKHFLNPNGTYTAVFGRMLHYEAMPGLWLDVDLNLQHQKNGSYVMDRHCLRVTVTGAGVEVVEKQSGVGILWLTSGTPAVQGRRATFADQGLSWTYTATKRGLKLEAQVDQPMGRKRYAFPYVLVGGSALRVDQAGKAGGTGFAVPPAFVGGANGERYDCGPWRLHEQHLSFTFDESVLPPQAYPYTIDPTTTFSVTAGADDGWAVKKSFGVYPPTANPFVSTNGQDLFTDRTYAGGDYQISVSLIRWDTSSLPDGTTVTAAILRGQVLGVANSGDGRSLTADWYTAWPIDIADWTATAGVDAHAGTTLASITPNAQKDFTLINVAANVSKTGYTGLRLHISGGQPTGENNVFIAALEHTTLTEPQLVVTYSLPAKAWQSVGAKMVEQGMI